MVLNKNGEPSRYWSGLNFAQLASEIGFKETYDKDYRFLSNIAHCSSSGLLLGKINNELQIQTDRLIGEILVYGTKYMLWITANWNEHFQVVEEDRLKEVLAESVNFDFKPKP